MKFYEVTVEAEDAHGSWIGTGYWFCKPEKDLFALVLEDIRAAVALGVFELDLWRDRGFQCLINVIDVPVEDSARFQRDAYIHDQSDRQSRLQWVLVSARVSLNGDGHHG